MQPIQPQLDAWITVADAASATAKSERTWRRLAEREAETAKACGRPARARRACAGRGASRGWEINRSMDRRLSVCPSRATRTDAAREALLAKYGERHVTAAYLRARWLNEWMLACSARRRVGETERSIGERIAERAQQEDGEGLRIGWRALQDWKANFYAVGPDGQIRGVGGLIDNRCKSSGMVSRSPEAVKHFYSLYHTENRIPIKRCHDMTARRARKSGWGWPAGYSATCRWLSATDDRALTLLMRQGSGAYSHRYMQHLEIDYSLIQPGELYVCDHTQCDFWVTYKNQQIRPWLTAILDCRSRVIVGWRLGPSPHQNAILEALLMAFRDWAIPDNMRIDNGKDFCSKTITGLTKAERQRVRRQFGGDYYKALTRERDLVDCVDTRFLGVTGELGVDLIYAIPYAAWSKGQIERWFGTFHGQCGKTFATYCGNSTLARPECIEQIRSGYTKADKKALRKLHGKHWKKAAALKLVDQSAVPSLEDARARVGKWIELYHRTEHSAPDMQAMTPLACWATATRLRKAGENELMLLMATKGIYKVGANGVRVKAGSMPISYGARHPALTRLKGRDVLITADPASDRVDHVYAFTIGKGKSGEKEPRRFIAKLEANERVSPLATTDAAREAIGEQLRARKNMRQAVASAARRTRTATQLLNRDIDERLAEARATGTDPQPVLESVVPVITGFESVSIPDQTQVEPAPDPYAGVDLLSLALQGDDDDDKTKPDPYADWDFFAVPDEDDDVDTPALDAEAVRQEEDEKFDEECRQARAESDGDDFLGLSLNGDDDDDEN